MREVIEVGGRDGGLAGAGACDVAVGDEQFAQAGFGRVARELEALCQLRDEVIDGRGEGLRGEGIQAAPLGWGRGGWPRR